MARPSLAYSPNRKFARKHGFPVRAAVACFRVCTSKTNHRKRQKTCSCIRTVLFSEGEFLSGEGKPQTVIRQLCSAIKNGAYPTLRQKLSQNAAVFKNGAHGTSAVLSNKPLWPGCFFLTENGQIMPVQNNRMWLMK